MLVGNTVWKGAVLRQNHNTERIALSAALDRAMRVLDEAGKMGLAEVLEALAEEAEPAPQEITRRRA